MKLDNIVKRLKDNGFVESKWKKGRLIHPNNRDFIVDLYHYDECNDIEIGDIRNCAYFSVSEIISFIPESDDYGINVKILLNNNIIINLFCAFD